jgi:DNA-binding transcriptional LysR family regulator
VSRLIRDLEVRTGLVLFERKGNHLEPTPEAGLLLAEVEKYAVGLSSLAIYAQELAEMKRGALRIVALPAMAMGFLPQVVARFIEGRSLSRVHLHGMPSHLVIDAVAAGQADIGFAVAPAERSGLSIEPLDARAVVVVPRSHRLAARRSIRLDELRQERLVALSEPTIFASPLSQEIDELYRSATVATPLSGIACHFVEAGAGIALVDPFSIAGLRALDLVALPLSPPIQVRVGIVTNSNRRPSTLARQFIAALKDTMPSLLAPPRAHHSPTANADCGRSVRRRPESRPSHRMRSLQSAKPPSTKND